MDIGLRESRRPFLSPLDLDLERRGDLDLDGLLVLLADLEALLAGDLEALLAGDLEALLAGDLEVLRGGDLESLLAGDLVALLAGDLVALLAGDRDLDLEPILTSRCYFILELLEKNSRFYFLYFFIKIRLPDSSLAKKISCEEKSLIFEILVLN